MRQRIGQKRAIEEKTKDRKVDRIRDKIKIVLKKAKEERLQSRKSRGMHKSHQEELATIRTSRHKDKHIGAAICKRKSSPVWEHRLAGLVFINNIPLSRYLSF